METRLDSQVVVISVWMAYATRIPFRSSDWRASSDGSYIGKDTSSYVESTSGSYIDDAHDILLILADGQVLPRSQSKLKLIIRRAHGILHATLAPSFSLPFPSRKTSLFRLRSPHNNYVIFRGVVGSTARGANGALGGAASAPQEMRGGVPSYESRGSNAFIQECMMLGVINLYTS